MTAVPEGLADSRRPCAKVLSVSGFFASIHRFPLGGGFILRVKEASFLGRKAGTVDVRARSVIPVSNTAVMTVSRLAVYTVETGREAYIRGWEERLAWWEVHPGYTRKKRIASFLAQQ